VTVAEKAHRPAGRAMDGGILPGRPPRPALTSVVIPAFNAAATIAAQLDALAAQTYDGPWEVLVVDNGSTDRTREVVGSYTNRIPGLRVVDASDARGAAHARNAGAAAGGDLIAYCDGDDEVTEGWLDALVAAAATADVVGGALDHRSLNDPELADLRGGAETELPRAFAFLPYAISANMAVWRDVWEALGGWDTGFPGAAGEDVDFCWRAQLAGYTIAFAPAAVARYRHRDALGDSVRQVYAYAGSSAQLYRRFRAHGARRRSLAQVAGAWGGLAVRLPYLAVSRRRRAIWLVHAANNAGCIRGSIRHRVFCP
jgi:glycosyltransferase involved in cell wall biosynthesis